MDIEKKDRKTWKVINSLVLSYLHEKKLINYNEIDNKLGYSKGYFWKISKNDNQNGQSLSHVHVIALEYEFNIPKAIFFNPNILINENQINKEEIDRIIYEYRNKKFFTIENKFESAIEEFKKYTHFYIYDSLAEHKVVVRELHIDGTSVTMIQGQKRGEGFIYIASAHIIIVVESLVTGNTMILKIQRGTLAGQAFPVSYLGHSAMDNREIAGYGICTKGEIRFNEAKEILEIKDKNIRVSYSEWRRIIENNIKNFVEKKVENKT